jgi:hypothetical protein
MHDYHDAVLKTASISWETGTTILIFELCAQSSQEIRLSIQDTVHFEFPRRFPWGKSASVNRVELTVVDGIQRRVEIEMQSGDKIIVIGTEILEQFKK